MIYAIAPSVLKPGQIWIGTDNGLIQLTKDEENLARRLTEGIEPWV